jgi:hypothetical protein
MRLGTRLSILAAALILAISAGRLFGQQTIVVQLTNAAEVPAPTLTASGGGARPASFGTATFIINAAQTSMTMDCVISNIDVTGTQTPADTNDDLRNAHIHASGTVLPTTTAGVVWGFLPQVAPWTGNPHNNTDADFIFTPAATGVGGRFQAEWDSGEGNGTTFAAQLPNLTGFRAYINFHTVQNGPGEIRGMIPEPATLGMLLGAAPLALARLQRRRL